MSESKGEVEGHFPGASSAPPPAHPIWSVYILLCRDGAYYVGVTNNLARRWQEHLTGRGGHYTKTNPPLRIAHVEEFPSRPVAEARERQLKGWTRAKKEALIAGDLRSLKLL